MNLQHLKLCLVTQASVQTFDEYLSFIQLAAESGITLVQLRAKHCTSSEKINMAECLIRLLKPYRIPLIINDDIEVAKRVKAAGVHLGQQDASVEKAREILGQEAIIGLSIESEAQLLVANQNNNISYIGASAVFASNNKTNCQRIWGLEGLSTLCNLSVHPVMAIGGINHTNIKEVMQCGVSGIALINALHTASDVKTTTKQLIEAINHARS